MVIAAGFSNPDAWARNKGLIELQSAIEEIRGEVDEAERGLHKNEEKDLISTIVLTARNSFQIESRARNLIPLGHYTGL